MATRRTGYESRPTCLVCGAAGRPLYRDLADVTFGSAAIGSLSACPDAGCGTVWADPFPDPETIAGFYETYYTHDGGRDGATPAAAAGPAAPSPLRALAKGVLRRATRPSSRFASGLRYLEGRPAGRLLDVGCGNGAFLAEARARGWAVEGQEFDPAAAETARRVADADVHLGDLIGLGLPAARFDAITMSNVIEHLPNPREVLHEARRILKPGGRFVSVSPNPNSHLHRLYGEHWRGLEVPRHLFLFPPAAVARLAGDVGFARIEAFSTPGDSTFMETASSEIRARDRPDLPPLPRTTRAGRLRRHAATMLGRDVGEWTVLIADG